MLPVGSARGALESALAAVTGSGFALDGCGSVVRGEVAVFVSLIAGAGLEPFERPRPTNTTTSVARIAAAINPQNQRIERSLAARREDAPAGSYTGRYPTGFRFFATGVR
jgi:hypothetical protein